MASNPILGQGLETLDEHATRQPSRRESSRRRWPDDGLPARFIAERSHSPLHPFGLLGSVLGRR